MVANLEIKAKDNLILDYEEEINQLKGKIDELQIRCAKQILDLKLAKELSLIKEINVKVQRLTREKDEEVVDYKYRIAIIEKKLALLKSKI